jgi:hypothetical protein
MNMELPQYTLKPNTNRMTIPWIFKLLGLSILFYGGIYFNAKYALKMEIPPYINILIFLFIIVLVVTQLILYHVRFGKYKYQFYMNRIEYEGKKTSTFLYSDFQNADLKQGVFDKMMNTGIIKLTKEFSIGPISNATQIQNYLIQLVQYYRASEQKYNIQQQQAAMQREMANTQQQQQAAQSAPVQTNSQQPAQTQQL